MIKIQKEEINTGRQNEMDVVKGFLMIIIVLVHSFQTIADSNAANSNVYKIIFAAAMPTAACLFLFVMGFGSVYSRKSSPKELVKSGVMLLFYQALSNACYGACLAVAFAIRSVICGDAEQCRELYDANMYSMLTFINIFFISGMCYFVLALFKRIKVPVWGYAAAAVIVALLAPFLGKITSGNVALNWILDATFGGKGETSFCFFPYISFVLMGYVFAKVIRRVNVDDKRGFYRITGAAGLIILVIWLVVVILKHPSVDESFNYMNNKYRIPGLAKVLSGCGAIIASFALAYFISPILKKCKFIYNKLISYSNNISKLYAVHIGVYMIILAATGFKGYGIGACFAWSLAVLIITDLLVALYIKIEKNIRERIRKNDSF